jgi:uncharacterized protein (TIGR02271 family)
MATDNRTVVMGVFRDHTLAEQAANDLRHTEWGAEQVSILGRNSGGFLERVRSAFGEHEAAGQGTDELAQLDLPEEQRQYYQHELDNGALIVIARPLGHQLETRDILNRRGAYGVFTPFQLGEEQSVQLRQEVPEVQKTVVQVGEVRIHKRIITEQRTFTVPVTREEVTIERVPTNVSNTSDGDTQPDRQVDVPTQTGIGDGFVQPNLANDTRRAANPPRTTDATYAADVAQDKDAVDTEDNVRAVDRYENEVLQGEGTLRILVHEEQVFINKQTVVIEEILVHKELLQETRQLVEPIRHEEARIEQVGNASIREEGVETGTPSNPA